MAMLASACGASDDAITTVRAYDVLKAIPRSTVQQPSKDMVRAGKAFIDNEEREVLFMHPTSSLELPAVRVEADSSVRFGAALMPDAWDKATDGVTFSVVVRTADGTQREIYRRHIDPAHNPVERRWVDQSVSLKPYAGTDVRVMFRTYPGPAGNTDFDWAVWGAPSILIDKK
jgi:hypothetical protein